MSTNAPKSYSKAGELHLRRAAETGDAYLSGTITVTVDGTSHTVPVTVFTNKKKFIPSAPDAYIFVGEKRDIQESSNAPADDMDDIPF
jgi:hypothetical protein